LRNLPNLRDAEKVKVKGLISEYTIRPWSNNDVILFNDEKEQLKYLLNDGVITKEVFQNKIFEKAFEKLVLPNIIPTPKKIPNVFDQRLIFIEMYAISRGIEIEVVYECPNCFDENAPEHEKNKDSEVSTFIFDLSEDIDVKNEVEPSKFVIEVQGKEIVFHLKSDFDFTYNEDDSSEIISLKYLCSFVTYLEIDGVKEYPEIEELVNWLANEIPEIPYNDFLTKMGSCIPYIRYEKADIVCEHCGYKSKYTTNQLPDFSLLGWE